MSTGQKGIFLVICGLLMLMGTMGGVEQTPDLASWDGVYLTVFTLVGLVMMLIGVGYINGQTDEFLGRYR